MLAYKIIFNFHMAADMGHNTSNTKCKIFWGYALRLSEKD